MPSISDFIDPAALRAFRRALPGLRRTVVAQRAWDAHDRKFGVAGNTFRAYVGWRHSPAATFREWAERATHNAVLNANADEIRSQELFDCWHRKLAKSLQRAWRRTEGSELSVAHKYKLIDLYVKWLTQHRLPNARVLDASPQRAGWRSAA